MSGRPGGCSAGARAARPQQGLSLLNGASALELGEQSLGLGGGRLHEREGAQTPDLRPRMAQRTHSERVHCALLPQKAVLWGRGWKGGAPDPRPSLGEVGPTPWGRGAPPRPALLPRGHSYLRSSLGLGILQVSDPAAPYLDGLAQEGGAPLGVGEECRHGGRSALPLCVPSLGEDSEAARLCKEPRAATLCQGRGKEGGERDRPGFHHLRGPCTFFPLAGRARILGGTLPGWRQKVDSVGGSGPTPPHPPSEALRLSSRGC